MRADVRGPALATLRNDSAAVQRLAERTVSGETPGFERAVHGGNVRNVSGRLTDSTFELGFTVPEAAANRFGGLTFFELFHHEGRGLEWYEPGTDRIVVTGPPGTVLLNDVHDVDVVRNGRAARWTRSDRVSGYTYLVFGTDETAFADLLIMGALSVSLAEWLLGPSLLYGLPVGVFLLVLGGISRQGSAGPDDESAPEDSPSSDPSMLDAGVAMTGWMIGAPPLVTFGLAVGLLGMEGVVLADVAGTGATFPWFASLLALGVVLFVGYVHPRTRPRKLDRTFGLGLVGVTVMVASLQANVPESYGTVRLVDPMLGVFLWAGAVWLLGAGAARMLRW